MIELHETNSAEIASEFIKARKESASPAMGMVLTLVVVVDDDGADAALKAACQASKGHPARVLAIILGDGRGRARVDAQIGMGSGETALITLRGAVVSHAESVVLPLLLPDSPVVVWWAGQGPDDPASDSIGALATRRITDLGTVPRPRSKADVRRYAHYQPGDTDLAWTRLTLWRAVLTAALDQSTLRVRSAQVRSEPGHPSVPLLRAWLQDRLGVEVELVPGSGPAVTEVTLETSGGPISIRRPDGRDATLCFPGRPDRSVALRIRELPELLSEEMQHLDADEIYEDTIKKVIDLDARDE